MTKLLNMALDLKIGQHIQGKFDIYSISAKLHKHVWIALSVSFHFLFCRVSYYASSGTKASTVIVKTAPTYLLENECEVLKRFQGRPHIRQLIDEVRDPPSIVLKHLGDNLLNASNSKRLERSDVKYVAKKILEALSVIHEAGYVHTGRLRGTFRRPKSPKLIIAKL